jgi:hypothetical protein
MKKYVLVETQTIYIYIEREREIRVLEIPTHKIKVLNSIADNQSHMSKKHCL